jgi:hypothetical protein
MEAVVRVVHIFKEVDMRCGHEGLRAHAKRSGVNVDNIDGVCVFVSRSRMLMKTYSANGVLSYLRAKEYSRPIDIDALAQFPLAFSKDGRVDYTLALRKKLEKVLQR